MPGYYFLTGVHAGFALCFPLTLPCLHSHAIIYTDTNENLLCIEIFVYVELKILEYMPFVVTNSCFSGTLLKFIVLKTREKNVMLWE